MMKHSLALLPLMCACGTEPARDLIVQTTISVAPATERYECYRVTVREDVFVSRISAGPSPSVHHQILGLVNDDKPDGQYECGSISEVQSWLYTAAHKPDVLELPPGVAYHLPAGRQLMLNMHLLNATDDPIEAPIAFELTGIAEAEVEQQAQLIEAGTVQINIPPHAAATALGKCTLDKDVSVFAVLPHMHFMGTSFKASIGETVIYAGDYNGEAQPFTSLAPVTMPAGTPLDVECNYFNTTGQAIKFGSSGKDEMCFAATYYFPAIENQPAVCIH